MTSKLEEFLRKQEKEKRELLEDALFFQRYFRTIPLPFSNWIKDDSTN